MIGGERFARNAFRVLGLSADASASDVHKAAATARRAFSLGLDEISEADVPELGLCPRNESTIRTALGQLANPADRLTHRLLWFHLPRSKSADQVFSLKKHHDDCLWRLVELTATDAARFEPNDWTTALLNWHLLLSRDDYWEVTTGTRTQRIVRAAGLLVRSRQASPCGSRDRGRTLSSPWPAKLFIATI